MTQWGLDALFNPGKRHMDEEKRRLQSTREEIGDSSGGKRIDLESGKVTLGRRKPADTDTDTDAVSGSEEDGSTEPGSTEPDSADPGSAEHDRAEPDRTEPDRTGPSEA